MWVIMKYLRLHHRVSIKRKSAYKESYTQLKTPFTFSSNTHSFKGTEGHFYQFWKKHLIFWVITICTFLLFQGKAFNILGDHK